jgi:nucleoside phosphorylase
MMPDAAARLRDSGVVGRAALALAVALVCAVPSPALAARRSRICTAVGEGPASAPYVAVLSAFPAELAPLVAAAAVQGTVEHGGRSYYVGRLGGVSVILGLMGIGMVNAERTAVSLLESVPVAAVLVSGVAGSPHRIGDVVLADRWMERDGARTYRTNRALAALAARAADRLAPLEQCTPVPPALEDAPLVCMAHAPVVLHGGLGMSGDPFGEIALPCFEGGGEVYGCDLPAVAAALRVPVLEDMETAAVARVARARRVPFLGVRAVSDGEGDPLGDRTFPTQFNDYYKLAARNAGAVTAAVVGELGRLATARSGRRTCRLLGKGQWTRAARRIRKGSRATARPVLDPAE